MRLIFLTLFLCLLYPSLVSAREELESDVIILCVGAVHEGDYFAWGKSIEISGTVNGDVYLFGEQIVVDGVVNGDVLVCGGSVDISGNVTGNVRALAGQVLLSGNVGSRVTAVSGNIQLPSSGSIGGSIVAVAGNVDLAGKIDAGATLVASNLRISARIKKSVMGYVGHMRIASRAQIDGDVDYQSNTPAWIDQGAVIGGKLVHHPSFVHELIKGTWIQKLLVGSKVAALLMNFFYSLVIGIILLKFFPKNLDEALTSLAQTPWKALGYGVVLLILLPLVSLILLMTILGIPFALTLIAFNIIGLYTAKIYSICFVSNWAFRAFLKPNHIPSLCLGLLVYFCLTAIPIFGVLVAIISMLFGLGAGVIAQARRGILH